jgi:hypothetical protein
MAKRGFDAPVLTLERLASMLEFRNQERSVKVSDLTQIERFGIAGYVLSEPVRKLKVKLEAL